mmetsp:Transcript_48870/g.93441  ORF Transcript_48870/g.93441 Transcript_48870/m.93441 type:complete len:215 (-) Transcript_48870:1417-2061(-)
MSNFVCNVVSCSLRAAHSLHFANFKELSSIDKSSMLFFDAEASNRASNISASAWSICFCIASLSSVSAIMRLVDFSRSISFCARQDEPMLVSSSSFCLIAAASAVSSSTRFWRSMHCVSLACNCKMSFLLVLSCSFFADSASARILSKRASVSGIVSSCPFTLSIDLLEFWISCLLATRSFDSVAISDFAVARWDSSTELAPSNVAFSMVSFAI